MAEQRTNVSLTVEEISCILHSIECYEGDEEYNKMIYRLDKKMNNALVRLGYERS